MSLLPFEPAIAHHDQPTEFHRSKKIDLHQITSYFILRLERGEELSLTGVENEHINVPTGKGLPRLYQWHGLMLGQELSGQGEEVG